MRKEIRYVVVTPARNEQKTIEACISSIVNQKMLPCRWVLVSDASSDRTDEMMKKASSKHDFIRYVRKEKNEDRNFASKVSAITTGINCLDIDQYDYIGFMDADITVDGHFFSNLLEKMENNPKYGLGGGAIYEKENNEWECLKAAYDISVAGALQMFRRQCYEDIGGYRPLPLGGIDMVAEAMARMRGWTVKTCTDLKVYHHAKQGRTHGNTFRALFRRGRMEYINGYHPLFQMARIITWLKNKPIILASVIRTAGYFWAMAKREQICISDDLYEYLQMEQIRRIRMFIK